MVFNTALKINVFNESILRIWIQKYKYVMAFCSISCGSDVFKEASILWHHQQQFTLRGGYCCVTYKNNYIKSFLIIYFIFHPNVNLTVYYGIFLILCWINERNYMPFFSLKLFHKSSMISLLFCSWKALPTYK